MLRELDLDLGFAFVDAKLIGPEEDSSILHHCSEPCSFSLLSQVTGDVCPKSRQKAFNEDSSDPDLLVQGLNLLPSTFKLGLKASHLLGVTNS